MRRALRLLLRVAMVAAGLLLVLSVAGVLLLRSAWFYEQVQARIVREMENSTGGRVEISSFTFHWRELRAEISGLVIHGLEGPEDPPLFRCETVSVGLKIVSAFRRKIDIASLAVRAPEVSVIVGSDGRTNIPEPRRAARPGRKPLEQFLDLAVGEYRIDRGRFRYRSRVFPLDLEGERLEASLLYDRAAKAYEAEILTEQLRVSEPLAMPLAVDASIGLRLDNDSLRLARVRLASKRSQLTAKGAFQNLDSPSGELSFDGTLSVAEIGPVVRLPLVSQGEARVRGTVSFQANREWTADGALDANGLSFRHAGISISGIRLSTPYRITTGRLALPALRLVALGGEFSGAAELSRWSALRVEGQAAGLSLQQLNEARNGKPLVWAASVSGPVRAAFDWSSPRDLKWETAAELTLERSPGGLPLAGLVALNFSAMEDQLTFGDSHLEFPSSRVHFRGSLPGGLEFGLHSGDLNDLLPALAVASDEAPDSLPLRLDRGVARFEGTARGSWAEPEVSGRLRIGPFLSGQRRVLRLEGDVRASASGVRLNGMRLEQESLLLEGSAEAALENWRLTEASRIDANVKLSASALDVLLAENSIDLPFKGKLAATVDLDGTYGGPRALGSVSVSGFQAWDESFDQLSGEFRYTSRLVEVVNGTLREGKAVAEFSGSLERRGDEWRNSTLSFRTSGKDFTLKQWAAAARLQPNLDGRVNWRGAGAANLVDAGPRLTSLEGEVRVQDAAVEGRAVGNLTVSATTRGRLMLVTLAADIGGSPVKGNAEWTLGGDSYGLGQVQVSRLSFEALQDVGLLGDPDKPLPVRGFLDGELGFSGPVLKPEIWTGAAKISRLEVEPNPGRQPTGGPAQKRIVLRNRDPLLAHVDHAGLHVQSARVIGEGTDLEVTGTVAFRARNPWNLHLRGTLELPTLAMLEPDLLATGVSTLDASIRGSLTQPQVTGHLELKDGSFYLRGVPNGIDKANGVILFDRTRATIDRLTAQTGGGDLELSGFIGFGGDALVYRLQANAQRVRVRYPAEVSTTFDATLSLSGTATRSMLSGVVTVTKMGITPRTDFGSLLAQTGRAVSAPAAPNEFLRNMQLDVRLQTSPDAELQTSLTRDIQPEADLRLRGGPANPVLLGRVSVTRGEIQFFGTQYTITQGDISFFNPVKLEPVLNLDLETRVRGIIVTINFSGPISKLNVSYRSDPPLQSSEIIALLTVGRAPGTAVTPTSYAGSQNQSLFMSGGNSLLGQAVTAPISGRLQRLFGVSRLKIDPELTGVTNTPQARLTIEQQLSRDVLVTYITNLNRTQQQIVRLQWDFSKDFSVVAVRDENGIFGVDFQYRRRFK